jgi:hypothetical protein
MSDSRMTCADETPIRRGQKSSQLFDLDARLDHCGLIDRKSQARLIFAAQARPVPLSAFGSGDGRRQVHG